MAESKRTFNSAKMNRDIDDRLLHPGEYRYAMNVNIGESEGGDIGAVENLKGNELIAGQDLLNGTTIGVVRDPNADRIYWFNKGETVDGIYEYDERTGNVNPILLDQVSNPLQKPSCTPNFSTPISDPDSDTNTRPDLPELPLPPRGTCMLEFGPNGRRNTNYDPTGDFADNASCIEAAAPPPATSLGVTISGDGSFANTDSPVTLTATPVNLLGTATFSWSTSETTSTLEVSGADQTITGSVTVTDSGRTTNNTATANYSVTFSAVALPTYTFSWLPSGSITNATISGGISNEEGTENVAETLGGTITIDPDDGFQWQTLPTVAAANPALPSGLTQGALVGTVGSENAASVSLSGTWTPSADYSGTVSITGGVTEPVPVTAMFTGFSLTPGIASSAVNQILFTMSVSAENVETPPTAATINFDGTINGSSFGTVLTTVVPPTTNPSIIHNADTNVLIVVFNGRWESTGSVNNGGGVLPISPAGANTVVINSITVTFTGGSIASPTTTLPLVESRFGVTGTTHTSFPATLVTP